MKSRRGIPVVGDVLRGLRKDRNWSQEEACRRAGVSVKLLRKAEQGEPIDAESVAVLAALYSSANRPIAPQDLVAKASTAATTASSSGEAALLGDWLIGVWGRGDWKLFETLCAPAIRFHCRIGLLTSREQLRSEVAEIRDSFSEIVPRLDSSAQHGSLAVGRWVMAMRQTGDWLGQPPTGDLIELVGVTTLRIASGQIVEGWEYWHPSPSYQQLDRFVGHGLVAMQEQLPRDLGTPLRRLSGRPRSFILRGEYLRWLRAQKAWTQREAAQAMGVSERLLRKAEKGGPVDAGSVAALALGYTTAGRRMTPEELLADPAQLRFAPSAAFELGARVQQWFDAQWNKPNFELLDELATPDFVFHAETGIIRGPAELKQRVLEFRQSFSDFSMLAEEVCDLGDALAVRWTCSMTHAGQWLDLPATGRRVTIRGSSWAQQVGAKFGDAWDFWDPAVIYAQLA